MIRTIIILTTFCLCLSSSYAQTILKGIVYDDKQSPIAFANVFIDGTIDGTNSNEDGKYELETEAQGIVTLKVSFIGYQTYTITKNISELNNLSIILKPNTTDLKEVEVTAGSFQLKGGSTLEHKNAVELVTTAGSEGDLYKSIGLLPGTQAAGVDGKLQVRGGSSHESQTYIDDMHVMSPYSSMPESVAVRGRFSPFIFEGINFSMGGYSPEYSQSLSSVLPLSTKDESAITKTGANITSAGVGTGGTKAWDKASTSFDISYNNLEPYTKVVFPNEKSLWKKYYQGMAATNQTRFQLGEKAYLKTFITYDKTLFNHKEVAPFTASTRWMDFDENNLYLNSTFRKRTSSGINYFAGVAYSWNNKKIMDALVANDRFKATEKEIHLKTKADKRFSNTYKLGVGIENLTKSFEVNYRDVTTINEKVNHNISGMYVTNDFNLSHNLLFNVSSRLEYTSLDKSWAVLPRIALNYNPVKDIILSAAAGKYQQTASNDYLVYNKKLSQENTTQGIVSTQYKPSKHRLYRIEAYYKQYDKLITFDNNQYSANGDGYSRGLDFMVSDSYKVGKGQTLECMVTYSFNDSKRKYMEYNERVMPSYITKHNSSAILKYFNQSLKSSFGITTRFASGRPYHNPNKEGIMNEKTPIYNSLDLSWTFLAHKKLIIYACASNILNRENVYGYHYNKVPDITGTYQRVPIKAYQKQFFYIGFFISLSGKAAYDTSNF